MVFCTQCGKRNVDGAKFCFNCGEKITIPDTTQNEDIGSKNNQENRNPEIQNSNVQALNQS